jgi:ABC-type oligopeptide transport system substrate-binding subunit
MKKILAIMLVIAMVIAVSACATVTPTTSPSAAESVAPQSQAPAETSAAPEPTKTPGVLENPLVRQALSLAVDRAYINETVFNNGRIPAYGVASPGVPDATPGSDFRKVGGDKVGSYWGADYAADLAKAKELLAQAGYPDGKDFPVLELAINTGTGHQKVAEAIQSQWAKNLGINVKLASMEWNTFQTYRKTAQSNIARQGWLGDYTDPATFFDLFTSTAGTNDGHYNNPKYDELVNAARTEQDPAKRMDEYHQAEKIIMEDAGIIPIVYYADDVLSQTNFTPYDAATGKGYQQVATGLKQFHNTTKAECTVCVGPEPATLDPNLNESVDGMIYINALFEGFYRQELDGKFSLGQAKDFKIDGNTVTVTLKDGLVWSDGKPVTAHDWEYSWKRLVDPATASSYAYIGEFLKNGKEVEDGKVAPSELSCKALDDKTFQFEIKAPSNYLIDLMAFPSLMPLRQDIVEANPEGWTTDPKTMVFNGRYTLQTFAHEDQLVMVKNEKYWDPATTTTTKVTYKLMSDDNAILAAFKAKKLDLADSFPAGELAALEKTPEYHRFGNIGLYYFQLQQLQP